MLDLLITNASLPDGRKNMSIAVQNGARFRYGEPVREILVERGRAAGVVLGSGERLMADAVVCNADPAAIAAGKRRTTEKNTARLHPALPAVHVALLAATSNRPVMQKWLECAAKTRLAQWHRAEAPRQQLRLLQAVVPSTH